MTARQLHGLARWQKAITDADLGATEKAVLIALILHITWSKDGEADDPHPECWPAVQTIADSAGLRSRKGVQIILRRLRDKGVLHFTDDRRGGMGENGKPRTAHYRLDLDRLDAIKRERGSRQARSWGPSSANGVPVKRVVGSDQARSHYAQSDHHHTNEKTMEHTHEQSGGACVETAASFEHFWDRYPRRTAKQAARKAWDTATRTTDPAVIIDAAAEFAASPAASDPQFVPYPATWLNAERWQDDRADWQVRRGVRIVTPADRRAARDAATDWGEE